MSPKSQTPRTGIHTDDITFRGFDLKARPSGTLYESSDVVNEGLNRAPQIDIVQVTDNQITSIGIESCRTHYTTAHDYTSTVK